MIAIDAPYNSPLKPDTTSTYNPRMIASTNYPIPGDDAYFISWKNKKIKITSDNKSTVLV